MSWAEEYKTVEDIKKYMQKDARVGIEPSNLAMFSVTAGDGILKVRFTEPADTVIDGQTLCTWKGCRVVYKQGEMPVDETDGIFIEDVEEKGKYTSKDIVISGLVNGEEYFVRVFPYSDQGVFNRNEANVRVGVPKEYTLLGFRINKKDSNPKTRVEYLEAAVGLTPAGVNLSTGAFSYGGFGDFWFVTENKPFMVKYDGTPDYELNPNDYTKKLDGSASDVSNKSYAGNCMAKIPLVWMKQFEQGDYEYCYICDIQLDDSYKAYAHQREDGSIMDYIWLSCFEGALDSSKIRSIKGLTPMANQTGTNELTYAANNGEKWTTRTWSQRNLINMLLILMSKSTDSQTAFGYGYHTGGSSSSPNYLTTGGAHNKGQFYGTNANRDYVKVFHIENWWGDIWERIAGLLNVNGKIYTKMTKPYNTTGSGYKNTNLTPAGTSGGYVSGDNMSDQGLLPVTASGSQTTYVCDGLWFNNSQVDYAIVGGASDNGFLAGAFCVNLYDIVSYSSWDVGAALSCEQPSA